MDNTFSNSFDCIVKLNNPLMGTETSADLYLLRPRIAAMLN